MVWQRVNRGGSNGPEATGQGAAAARFSRSDGAKQNGQRKATRQKVSEPIGLTGRWHP